MDTLKICDRLEDMDRAVLHRFLSEEAHWQKGIGPKTLERALENSLCVGAFIDGGQVGFARVITDYATFAWIDDVFVDPSVRGQGVAYRLMEAIIEHRKLKSIAAWWLSSSNPDARRLFEKFGFSKPEQERLEKWMARKKTKAISYHN